MTEDKKISELATLTGPDGTQQIPVNDGGTTKNVTIGESVRQADYKYVIWQDSGTYYARNGFTGIIDFSGTEAGAVINSAITASVNSGAGSIIRFGRGNFDCTTGILCTKSNMTFEGSGRDTTIIRRTADITLIDITGSSHSVVKIRFKNLSLSSDSSSYTSDALNATETDSLTFDTVRFHNAGRKHVYFEEVWDSRFINCFFVGNGDIGTTSPAVHIYGGSSDNCNNIYFDVCQFEENNATSCIVEGTGTGAKLNYMINFISTKFHGAAAAPFPDYHIKFIWSQNCNVWSGNITKADTRSIDVDSNSFNINISDCRFKGDATTEPTEHVFIDGNNCTIYNCFMEGGSTTHLEIGSNANDTLVSGITHVTRTSEADFLDGGTDTLLATFDNNTQTMANKTLTSPTLVTPALGTPASGVATNITGLPLTTGVTGTLPVANGGTGVTTSTGSGNTVLSTSPTLVTPVLGTPSSGDLSSCVGVSTIMACTITSAIHTFGGQYFSMVGGSNQINSTEIAVTVPCPVNITLTDFAIKVVTYASANNSTITFRAGLASTGFTATFSTTGVHTFSGSANADAGDEINYLYSHTDDGGTVAIRGLSAQVITR